MIVSRHLLALKLGRRVSKGEYERETTEYKDKITFVQSNSRGKHTGQPRTIRMLDATCPKWWRKHG